MPPRNQLDVRKFRTANDSIAIWPAVQEPNASTIRECMAYRVKHAAKLEQRHDEGAKCSGEIRYNGRLT